MAPPSLQARDTESDFKRFRAQCFAQACEAATGDMIRTLKSLKAQAAEVAAAPALDAPPPPAGVSDDGAERAGAGACNPGAWLPTQAAMADHSMRQRQHRVSFAEEVDEVPGLPGGHPGGSVMDSAAAHGAETQAAEPSLQFQLPSGSGSARASGAFGSSLGLAYVPTQGASEVVSQLPGQQQLHSSLMVHQGVGAAAMQTQVAAWGCWKSPGIEEGEDKLAAGKEDGDAVEEEADEIRGGDEGMGVGDDNAGGSQQAADRSIGEEIDGVDSQEGDDVVRAVEPDLTIGMDTAEEGGSQENAVEGVEAGLPGGDAPRGASEQAQMGSENEGYRSQPLSAKQGQPLVGFQRDALGCLNNLQRLAAAAGGMQMPVHESEGSGAGYVHEGQPHASLMLAGFSCSEPV